VPILTALSLPAVSTFPSADCIQWSGDGQVVVTSRYAIYILVSKAFIIFVSCSLSNQTPDPGINVDSSSVVKQDLDKSLTLETHRPIGWLTTMIEGNKGAGMHQWVLDSQGSDQGM
jgi:general transcription factor 3C polypeptide 4